MRWMNRLAGGDWMKGLEGKYLMMAVKEFFVLSSQSGLWKITRTDFIQSSHLHDQHAAWKETRQFLSFTLPLTFLLLFFRHVASSVPPSPAARWCVALAVHRPSLLPQRCVFPLPGWQWKFCRHSNCYRGPSSGDVSRAGPGRPVGPVPVPVQHTPEGHTEEFWSQPCVGSC